jgi:hypothetical protein
MRGKSQKIREGKLVDAFRENNQVQSDWTTKEVIPHKD